MENIENIENIEKCEKKSLADVIKKYCPKYSFVFFCICIVAVIIHITCIISEKFADFYNQNIGAFVRGVLAYLTKYLPFSLAETIIIGIPFILAALIYISVKQYKKSDLASIRCIVSLFSVLTLMYSIFVLGYGMGYHGKSLASKLKLEEKAVSAEELKYTAETILSEMTPLLEQIAYSENGASYMPYSLDEMNKKLNKTYKKATEKYDFIQDLHSNIKYIVLSEPMTYTHISGVYSYYTGEANLNINFPDYTLPYTAAHELAHQRGIAPENEANFVAFLVCMESDDAFIKYSAYLSMFEYVTNALYYADSEMYYDVISSIDSRIRYEMIAYNEFFEKYRQSVASEVSDVVNDTYLKTQGQSAGSASYGMVVDLAVAYYNQK
ncbi:MAG: DUF3810 domain-containing protein [Ruminococcaceae bacterium]|nr:DUF3810 domain-containing protein [Oscillospiraceae bacterium]